MSARVVVPLVCGVLLIAAAFGWGYHGVQRSRDLANSDYAACGLVASGSGCSTRPLPTTTSWTISSSGGFQRHYSVSVQTSKHGFFSINGLSKSQVEPFGNGQVLGHYHDGRLAALVASDGSTLKVPFVLDHAFLLNTLASLLLLIGGVALLALGVVFLVRGRSSRRPPAAGSFAPVPPPR